VSSELDVLARTATDGLRHTFERLQALAGVIVLITAAIGLATFATGWWVFDGSTGWLVVGAVVCVVPIGAAVLALWLVRSCGRASATLLDEVRDMLSDTSKSSSMASKVLIDHDSGVALGMQATTFGSMKDSIWERKRELPALYAGVRAIIKVPGLAAIAVIGMVVVGGLGTVLLLVGLLG
jgi:hypothetical protein